MPNITPLTNDEIAIVHKVLSDSRLKAHVAYHEGLVQNWITELEAQQKRTKVLQLELAVAERNLFNACLRVLEAEK